MCPFVLFSPSLITLLCIPCWFRFSKHTAVFKCKELMATQMIENKWLLEIIFKTEISSIECLINNISIFNLELFSL